MADPLVTVVQTEGSISSLRPSNIALIIDEASGSKMLRVDARAEKEYLTLSVKNPRIILQSALSSHLATQKLVFRAPLEHERPNNTIYQVLDNGSKVIITHIGLHVLVRPGNPNDALTYGAFLEKAEVPLGLQVTVEAEIIASIRSHEWKIENWGGEVIPLQERKP